MKRIICLIFYSVIVLLPLTIIAQSRNNISVKKINDKQEVAVTIGGKPFTTFHFADSMEKPFLYPIYTSTGQTITRGFPWNPEHNDPVDHPHHIGLWFNYENVNGLDFWNNSYAIAADKKKNYGWIRTEKILATESGKQGKLVYTADWTDQNKNVLLKEQTTFIFGTTANGTRVIDRITKLSAVKDVSMPDTKDGMLGLRMAHELELPIMQTKEYKDANGIVTKVAAVKDPTVSGNYLSSEGKQGEAVWGTRGNWCMLYGKKGVDTISVAIVDHPQNPGYPTYWHARNYGLFAANPIGQKVFSNGKQVLNFKLAAGQSAQFKYRIIIASGKERLALSALDQQVVDFSEH